jgi:hypothetical protein
MDGREMKDGLEGIRKYMWLRLNRSTLPAYAREGLKKTTKTSVMMADIPVDI